MNIINKTITTTDLFKLDNVCYEPDVLNGKVIVMCHGLTGVKQGRVKEDAYLTKLATDLCKKGFKVVQFDWRGHGKSSGRDLDVDCDSFFKDMEAVLASETEGFKIYLWGWSIGGFSIIQYLERMSLKVEKVVLWSPVLEPIASFFYNKNSLACYRSIVDSTKDGSLYDKGFALWSAKNFKITLNFLKQSRNFDFLKAINCLPKDTLILLGDNDVLVNKSFAENYIEEFGFQSKTLSAGHALIEDVDNAIDITISHFCK